MLDKNLKSCPFCGGNGSIKKTNNSPTAQYWISCNKCHAEPGGLYNLETAMSVWNTRHDDT
jgi:Lar family restriction alleviation protein